MLEAAQELDEPVAALAARRALAARLVLVELDPAQHARTTHGGLVEDHAVRRCRASSRPRRCPRSQRDVEVLGGEHRGRRAAGSPELQLVALADAARELEQLAQRACPAAPRNAGLVDVAGEREHLMPGDFSVPMRREPLGALVEDRRDARDRLDVVDDRRATRRGRRPRERRLQPRLAAEALERVEQRGLFAADVGAGAGVDVMSRSKPMPRMFLPRKPAA